MVVGRAVEEAQDLGGMALLFHQQLKPNFNIQLEVTAVDIIRAGQINSLLAPTIDILYIYICRYIIHDSMVSPPIQIHPHSQWFRTNFVHSLVKKKNSKKNYWLNVVLQLC